jgi:hypothetical protein
MICIKGIFNRGVFVNLNDFQIYIYISFQNQSDTNTPQVQGHVVKFSLLGNNKKGVVKGPRDFFGNFFTKLTIF